MADVGEEAVPKGRDGRPPSPGSRPAQVLRRLGDLLPPLGGRAWWLLAGYTLSNIGSGFVSPFLILYLNEVRDIGLGMAGVVLSILSVAGTLAVPVAGALSDRLGPGRTVVLSLAVAAFGTAGFAIIRDLPGACVAAALSGAGNAAMWNAFATMMAGVVPPSERAGVFGVSFGLQNLGVGLGAAAGGWLADVKSPGSFSLIFLMSAMASLLFAAVIVLRGEARWPEPDGAQANARHSTEVSANDTLTGYRVVLTDVGLIGAAVLNALAALVTTAHLDSGFPAWAVGPAGSTTRVVGIAFLANTVVIVMSQLLVLRFLRGRKRTNSTAAAMVLFGVSVLVTLLAGKVAAGTVVGVSLVLSLMIFGVGETILQPSLYAWVNDLAPERRRGRYNAVFNLSWQAGSIAGPPLAGLALQHGMGAALFLGLALVCLLGALLASWMDRIVPISANLGHRESPAQG